MTTLHKLVLYGLLGLLGFSLLLPGLMGIYKSGTGGLWLLADSVDARNHLRALNGMMAALGLMALWACGDLAHARQLVLALGMVMVMLVVSRLYSLLVDGMPGPTTLLYLVVEGLMAIVFLAWPPPKL